MRPELILDAAYPLEALDSLAAHIAKELLSKKILLLKGDLGAGKTTLTQKLAKHLGISGDINSPTFNIVNVLNTSSGENVYHFDLYRIRRVEELDEIGFEEYLDSGSVCIIEWPEIAENLIRDPYIELEISHQETDRHYRLTQYS